MEIGNNYLDLVLSMFNQYLYQDCKNNIRDITLYYSTNPATSGNQLIEELLGSIKEYPLESIGLPLFNSILAKVGKNQEESREIIEKIIKYKQMGKDEIKPARKYIRDIVANVYLQQAGRLYPTSPSEYLSYIKNINFKSSSTDYLNSTPFEKVDINTVVADSSSAYLTSSLSFINDSFTEGAFKSTDICVVSMPPSVGKSLLAEADALHMAINLKVPALMLIMGDLDMPSLMIRFAAIYSGLSFKEARDNLVGIYKEMSAAIGDRLDIILSPAGVINAKEFVDYVIEANKYKAVFIDYDENFNINSGGENMYTEFGELYNEFTRLKDAEIFTEVLCQPKQFTWSDGNVITLENLGTSSRKGHIADVCITRNKEPEDMNGLGTFFIAKNRHGRNVKAYSIRLRNGRFKIIPKSIYDDLKQLTEPRDFTEADIDHMIMAFETSRRQVQEQIERKMTTKGPTPF